MNFYDNEENIIRLVQSLPLRDVWFINPSYEAIKFFFSIRLGNDALRLGTPARGGSKSHKKSEAHLRAQRYCQSGFFLLQPSLQRRAAPCS